VLVGKLWTLVLPFGLIARRMSLCSAALHVAGSGCTASSSAMGRPIVGL